MGTENLHLAILWRGAAELRGLVEDLRAERTRRAVAQVLDRHGPDPLA
ncbi:hypothetical protein J2W56_006677 [Nocardia kruczakiae]|uniref:Uncharacterized protein n=1 Tax=Nocardia kruczakiae TaxID=261477 RepID=A0ABU1XQR8_9NOCA|nr:hypothetical protein [Nocardia kruczakiae]MDR7172911.1 hypothetical protein [Nocardia kruczakiae]